MSVDLHQNFLECFFTFSVTKVVGKSSLGKPRRRRENNTGLSKKMDGILNRYNLKSTGRIYTFGVLKCSEKFKVLDLP